ncbi:iron-sulfur cluster insertion protein ErpA [Herbaspirillum sp. HC18]|nr:iron-sulfur cluster insertion protein ErpA [Herbaspirillum sp. HC18]
MAELDAPMGFSDAAACKVAELIAEDGNPALKLRIAVSGGGCAGFKYDFAFDENVDEDDFRLDRNGVTVVVDAVSMQYLTGAEVDYEDSLEGARFLIRNIKASSTCGCGSSFSV